MCLMFTETSERFMQPRIVGCRARAMYCGITVPLWVLDFCAEAERLYGSRPFAPR
jgi:hypothetical protein